MVVIGTSTWSSVYFCYDEYAQSKAPTYPGVENSHHVCRAFHLPASQLSPVVKFFSLTSAFSLSLSTHPPFHSTGTRSPQLKGSGRNRWSREKAAAPTLAPTPPSSLPLLLNRLKHKHNWTCWKQHNGGGGGGVKSYPAHTHGCLGQGAINSTPATVS